MPKLPFGHYGEDPGSLTYTPRRGTIYYFHGTFINPSLYSALGARWRANGALSSNHFGHARLSAAIRSQASNFSPTQQADLNLPVLSLSSRLSVMASSTFPCRLTHVNRSLTVFYTAMAMWHGYLPRRLVHSIGEHSNWPASFQSLPMIRWLAYLDFALSAVTKR